MSAEPDADIRPALGAALAGVGEVDLRQRLIAAIGQKYGSQPRYNRDTRRYDRPPTFDEMADSSIWVSFTADDGCRATRGATVAEVVAEVMAVIEGSDQ